MYELFFFLEIAAGFCPSQIQWGDGWIPGVAFLPREACSVIGGSSWQLGDEIAIGDGYTSYPNQRNIVCGVAGAHAVWYKLEGGPRYSVWYNYYTGTEWTTAQKISTPSGNIFACHPCIASWLNNVYCAWENNWGCSEIVLRRFIGGNWEDTVIVISSGHRHSYTPSLVCDKFGVVHIVWERGYEIHYRKLQGSTLSSDTVLSNSGVYAAYPGIATFNNNIFVVWEDLRDGNFEIYFKEFKGNHWGEDIRVTNTENASVLPSLCVDSTGVVHIVWQEDGSGGYMLYYISYEQGSFSPCTLIAASPGEAITSSITALEDEVHLVWSDSRDGDWEIYYKIKNQKSKIKNGWSDDIRLTYSCGISGNPSVCASKDGNLYLLFWDTRDQSPQVYFKKKSSSKEVVPSKGIIQVSPNPFTYNTVIRVWGLGDSEHQESKILIYDVVGRVVREFNHLTNQPFNQIVWDGRDNQGLSLSSGLYFVKVGGMTSLHPTLAEGKPRCYYSKKVILIRGSTSR